MQKSTVLERKCFECIVIDLKCRWLQSDRADLEKHQTLAFLVDFLRIFKIAHLLDF